MAAISRIPRWRNIRDHLGWGGKQYRQVIRLVCDAAGISLSDD